MAKGETYQQFVEKFDRKAPKTTDDCYTPPAVYDAVLDFVLRRWPAETAHAQILRPFYPGGDYEHADYPAGAVVVDNPPFSIYARIVRFLGTRRIPFFLFAPVFTCLRPDEGFPLTYVLTNTNINYQNGAIVKTAFVTNLPSPYIIESSADLRSAIMQAQTPVRSDSKSAGKRTTIYPPEIRTSAQLSNYSGYTDFYIPRASARYVKSKEENFFGGALILSDSARERLDRDIQAAMAAKAAQDAQAAKAAKAIHVPLSPAARRIIDELNAAEQSAQ